MLRVSLCSSAALIADVEVLAKLSDPCGVGGGDLRGVWGERASSSAINVMIIHESGSNTKAAVSARQAE